MPLGSRLRPLGEPPPAAGWRAAPAAAGRARPPYRLLIPLVVVLVSTHVRGLRAETAGDAPPAARDLSLKIERLLVKYRDKAPSAAAGAASDSIPRSSTPTNVETSAGGKDEREDRIRLNNGDLLSGDVTALQSGVLTLKAYLDSVVKLPWSRVVSIETAEPYRLVLKDGSIFFGRLRSAVPPAVPEAVEGSGLSTSSSEVTIETSSAFYRCALSRIKIIESLDDYRRRLAEEREARTERLRKYWSGTVGIGVESSSGNTDKNSMSLKLDLYRKTTVDKLYLGLYGAYGKTNGVEDKNEARGELRLDVYTSRKAFYFVLGKLEYDKVQDLDLRSTVGCGLGSKIVDTDRSSFDVGGGVTFVREEFSSRKDSDLTALITMNHSRKISDNLKLSNKLMYYLDPSDTSDFRVDFTSSITNKLTKGLSLSLDILDKYDNTPEVGKTKNDLTVRTTIQHEF